MVSDMLQALSLFSFLLLLTKPAPALAWSRPTWYQLQLDLYPWEYKPNTLEPCENTLSCWKRMRGNRIYPMAGVMITTTMMLVMGRTIVQRWHSKHPCVTTSASGASKRRTSISDHALLLRVLHKLDALLLHMEGHLQRLAAQKCK